MLLHRLRKLSAASLPWRALWGIGTLQRPPTRIPEAPEILSIVSIDRIEPNPVQPRNEVDAKWLEELAASIRCYGLMQPLEVVPILGRRGFFQIVDGERRRQAAILAGLSKVPVRVRDAQRRTMPVAA